MNTFTGPQFKTYSIEAWREGLQLFDSYVVAPHSRSYLLAPVVGAVRSGLLLVALIDAVGLFALSGLGIRLSTSSPARHKKFTRWHKDSRTLLQRSMQALFQSLLLLVPIYGPGKIARQAEDAAEAERNKLDAKLKASEAEQKSLAERVSSVQEKCTEATEVDRKAAEERRLQQLKHDQALLLSELRAEERAPEALKRPQEQQERNQQPVLPPTTAPTVPPGADNTEQPPAAPATDTTPPTPITTSPRAKDPVLPGQASAEKGNAGLEQCPPAAETRGTLPMTPGRSETAPPPAIPTGTSTNDTPPTGLQTPANVGISPATVVPASPVLDQTSETTATQQATPKPTESATSSTSGGNARLDQASAEESSASLEQLRLAAEKQATPPTTSARPETAPTPVVPTRTSANDTPPTGLQTPANVRISPATVVPASPVLGQTSETTATQQATPKPTEPATSPTSGGNARLDQASAEESSASLKQLRLAAEKQATPPTTPARPETAPTPVVPTGTNANVTPPTGLQTSANVGISPAKDPSAVKSVNTSPSTREADMLSQITRSGQSSSQGDGNSFQASQNHVQSPQAVARPPFTPMAHQPRPRVAAPTASTPHSPSLQGNQLASPPKLPPGSSAILCTPVQSDATGTVPVGNKGGEAAESLGVGNLFADGGEDEVPLGESGGFQGSPFHTSVNRELSNSSLSRPSNAGANATKENDREHEEDGTLPVATPVKANSSRADSSASSVSSDAIQAPQPATPPRAPEGNTSQTLLADCKRLLAQVTQAAEDQRNAVLQGKANTKINPRGDRTLSKRGVNALKRVNGRTQKLPGIEKALRDATVNEGDLSGLKLDLFQIRDSLSTLKVAATPAPKALRVPMTEPGKKHKKVR